MLDDDVEELSLMPMIRFSEWLDEFLCRLFSLLLHLEPGSVVWVWHSFVPLYGLEWLFHCIGLCSPASSCLLVLLCLFLLHLFPWPLSLTHCLWDLMLQKWRPTFITNNWNFPGRRWSLLLLHARNLAWQAFKITI